jgi:hypothetical protein
LRGAQKLVCPDLTVLRGEGLWKATPLRAAGLASFLRVGNLEDVAGFPRIPRQVSGGGSSKNKSYRLLISGHGE